MSYIFAVHYGALLSLSADADEIVAAATHFCYICAVVAVGALLFLLWLLCRIAAGNVFDRRNVALLGWLSTCCLLISIITAVAVAWYFPCIIIAFAAGFLFLILRVVRHVFAAAVELKAENDMTI